ncbi:MAG: hypothetical protein HQ525_09955 [Anaerolineae bacterium]|nr:hypothetical protein [Anaerolineae bacterium]
MAENITDTLLKVGNTAINFINQEPAHLKFPKNSWQVSCSVNGSSLNFSILVRYEMFLSDFVFMDRADPFMWIDNIGILAGMILSKYNLTEFPETVLTFKINGLNQEKDVIMSCVATELVKEVNKKGIDGISKGQVCALTIMH